MDRSDPGERTCRQGSSTSGTLGEVKIRAFVLIAVAALAITISGLAYSSAREDDDEASPAHAVQGENAVVLVDHPFHCEKYPQPLNISVLRVTLTKAYPKEKGHSAVNLGNRGGGPRRDCSGRIGHLEVDTVIGDAVKVGRGAHDLVIESGFIFAHGKRHPKIHQDGIHFMGGKRIRIRNVSIYNQTGHAGWLNGARARPEGWPEDVVIENCFMKGPRNSVWTWGVRQSRDSGLRNCTVVAGTHKLERALTIRPDHAVRPVNEGNKIVAYDVPFPDEFAAWLRAAGYID
jgi:hypothetical protein